MTDQRLKFLGKVAGGRVLDVATGAGGFALALADGLSDWVEIIGIDADADKASAFADAFADRPGIRFEVMDATRPTFEPESFDTVAISNSLHHFDDAPALLAQMEQLLRPGGTCIVNERYRDRQTPAQRTHVELQHWCAAIDSLGGDVHRRMYPRADLLALVSRLHLADVRIADVSDTADDPRNPDTLDVLNGVIGRYLERAAGHPDLERRGAQLRRRLDRVGIHGPTELWVIGTKSA